MNSRRAGFTLIELMVVVLIMGLMASVAVLSVRGHIDRARWTRSFEQIEQLDRIGRIAARRDASRYQLRFNRAKRSVELYAVESNVFKKKLREVKLPTSLEFASFQKAGNVGRGNDFEVEIASNGQSPSYALSIQTSSSQPQWLVVLGFSGQQIRMENARDVAAILPR